MAGRELSKAHKQAINQGKMGNQNARKHEGTPSNARADHAARVLARLESSAEGEAAGKEAQGQTTIDQAFQDNGCLSPLLCIKGLALPVEDMQPAEMACRTHAFCVGAWGKATARLPCMLLSNPYEQMPTAFACRLSASVMPATCC